MRYMVYTMMVLVLCVSCVDTTKEVTVRPVKLRVVDAYNGKPLTNIQVYRIVDAYENIDTMLFGLLPRPEPKRKDRMVIKESAITDNNGCVYFKENKVLIMRNENLLEENLIINLNINKNICKTYKSEDVFFQLYNCFFEPLSCDRCVENIDKKYKGAYVASPCYNYSAEDYRFSETTHFSWIRINEGILKKSENITVKLKYYDGKPVKYDTSESDRKVLEFKKAWNDYKIKKYGNIEK